MIAIQQFTVDYLSYWQCMENGNMIYMQPVGNYHHATYVHDDNGNLVKVKF